VVSHSLVEEVTKLGEVSLMSGSVGQIVVVGEVGKLGKVEKGDAVVRQTRDRGISDFLASLRGWEIDMVLFLQSIGRIKIIVGSV
jgi:hypothetical protein